MTSSDEEKAVIAAFGVAVGLPVEAAVGVAGKTAKAKPQPKPKPAPFRRESVTDRTSAKDYPRLEASAFGKRRHRRGWAAL